MQLSKWWVNVMDDDALNDDLRPRLGTTVWEPSHVVAGVSEFGTLLSIPWSHMPRLQQQYSHPEASVLCPEESVPAPPVDPTAYSEEFVFHDDRGCITTTPLRNSWQFMHKFAFLVRAETSELAALAIELLQDSMLTYVHAHVQREHMYVGMGCTCEQLLEGRGGEGVDVEDCDNDTWDSVLDRYYVDMMDVTSGVVVNMAVNKQSARLLVSEELPVVRRVSCVLSYKYLFSGLCSMLDDYFILTPGSSQLAMLVHNNSVAVSIKPYVIRDAAARSVLYKSLSPLFDMHKGLRQNLRLQGSHVEVDISNTWKDPILAMLFTITTSDESPMGGPPTIEHVRFVGNNSCGLTFDRDSTHFLGRRSSETMSTVLVAVPEEASGGPASFFKHVLLRREAIHCQRLGSVKLVLDIADNGNKTCRLTVAALSANVLQRGGYGASPMFPELPTKRADFQI